MWYNEGHKKAGSGVVPRYRPGQSVKEIDVTILSPLRCCRKCSASKPLSAFHRDRTRVDGYCPTCKVCRVAAYAGTCEAAPVRQCRRCKKDKPSSEFHRDRQRSDGLSPYCKPCVLAYHETIIDAKAECNRKWQKANAKKVAGYTQKWWRSNRDTARQNSRKHRAVLHDAEGHYSAAEWRALCDWFGAVCLACGKSGVPLHADHVVAITRGGSNYIENIQPLCGPCNASKGNRRNTDYREPDRLAAFLRVYYSKDVD
jgi:5-methylcytosine-specific restriction endonuclease McrA